VGESGFVVRTTDERALLAGRLRAEGATLAEIGSELGVTRERARQLLARLSGMNGAEVRKARLQATLAAEQELRQSIIDDAEAHAPTSVSQAAERLGIDAAAIRRLAPRHVAASYMRPARDSTRYSKWPREEIARVLCEAATMSFPLSASSYDNLRTRRFIDGPSGVRIHQVFGSWSEACAYAGVECGPQRAGGCTSKWTDDDLQAAVAEYLEDPESSSTFQRFDEWSRSREELRSAQTVRNRLRPWSGVKRAALDLPRHFAGLYGEPQ
jgi:predicted transcriptional regulator